MDWPPFSPDLNPIEHVWSLLKRSLPKLYPELVHLKANTINRARLAECLITAWRQIDQDVIDRLIMSLPERLQSVKNAGGWYTKY